MQVYTLNAAVQVYLPYDSAVVPFGDPFQDVTITSSTTAVISVPGYAAAVNDIVGFTPTAGNTLASGISSYAPAGQYSGTQSSGFTPANGASGLYYVTSVTVTGGVSTFTISSTKGGSAVATTTSNSAAGQVTIYLLNLQKDGTLLPFKAGASVVVMNLSGTSATLQTAADTGQAVAGTNTYNQAPLGAGAYTTVATVASGTAQVVVLNNDWVRASGSNLVMIQN